MAVFVASASITLAATPVAFRLAAWRGWFDRPADHKAHVEAMPYLGGAAIAFGFATAVIVGSAALAGPARMELVVIMGAALALSVMGLVDDVRGLGPIVRIAVEAIAALVVFRAGSGVLLFDDPLLDGIVTVVWIVGITNAFNLLDNMDGLSAGVAAIAATFFFVLSASEGQYLVAMLAVGLAGCALAFLRHNFHPARIYMGDAGSLFLGFLLAVVGVKLRFIDAPRTVLFVPILVLGVAVFDTTLVTLARVLHHRSPFVGGLDHTSHRLVAIGIPVPVSVALIYAGAVSLGWLALVVSRVDAAAATMLIVFAGAGSAFFGVLLGMVPVYESSTRRRMVLTAVGATPPAGERPARPLRVKRVTA